MGRARRRGSGWPRWPERFGFSNRFWYAYGVNAQRHPALYYPPIPTLQQVAHSTPGRVIGYNCLPAILAQSQGLNYVPRL